MHLLLYLLIFFNSSLLFAEEIMLNKFELVMVAHGEGGWGAIRYTPTTGKSWYIQGDSFIPIMEKNIPPHSEYKVIAIKTNTGWSATRIDVYRGTTWYLNKDQWVLVKESE